LEEGHKCDVFRLHNYKMPPPAQRRTRAPNPTVHFLSSGDAIRRGAMARSEARRARLQMEW
jgi:hypothetical protein